MPTASKKSQSPAPKQSKPARPAEVKVAIDRALKKRWDEILKVVEGAKREGAGAFDRLWESVAAIVEHDPPLYLAGGFSTAKAFIAAHLGETERTARRNMRIAKYASPVEEERYGTSKLDAALGYLEAKSGGAQKGRLPVDFEKLRIPVARDGKEITVPLADALVQEINLATRKLLRGATKPHPKASPLHAAVSAGLGDKALRGITVRVAGDRIFLGNIPSASLPALARALGKVKAPAGK